MAAIEALRALQRPCIISLTTDSQYVKKGITEWLPGWQAKGWKTANRKPVKNADLWKELSAEVEKHQKIDWHWVKGHSGHHENEWADELATQAIDELQEGKH